MARNISTKPLTGLLGDVRRSNNFIITVADVFDGTNLELVIDSAFLPSVSLNVISLTHGNDSKKFAGVATWNGGQLKILDTLNRTELDAVLAWFKKSYDWTNGAVGLASEYKKSGYITEYAADGRYIRKWEVEGAWISDFDLGQLDATSAELKKYSLTIQIDPSRSLAPIYEDEEDSSFSNNGVNELNQ